jgi:hypothetical protein
MSARAIGTREFTDGVAGTDEKTSAGVTARGSLRISVQTGIDQRRDFGVSDRRRLRRLTCARRSIRPKQVNTWRRHHPDERAVMVRNAAQLGLGVGPGQR